MQYRSHGYIKQQSDIVEGIFQTVSRIFKGALQSGTVLEVKRLLSCVNNIKSHKKYSLQSNEREQTSLLLCLYKQLILVLSLHACFFEFVFVFGRKKCIKARIRMC